MEQTLTKINALSPVKSTLENLKIGASVDAPRYQRGSIKQAICRIKDECHKRYSIKTMSDIHINVKRIR
jgi:hypothetical protein